MTQIATNTSQQYLCDGVQTEFAIPFTITDEDELQVYLRNEAVDPITETILSNPGEYTVDTAFTKATTVATYSSDYRIVLRRNTPITQESDYADSDPFAADTLEGDLDKMVRIIQELNAKMGRAVLVPVTTGLSDLEYPQPAAGELFRWNPTADGLEAFTFDVTEAEVSYLEGVTSSLQDQLDALVLGSIDVSGTFAAPNLIAAGGVIPFTSSAGRVIVYVAGSGAAVSTISPYIQAGSFDGQEVEVVGCDDTNTVTMVDGAGTGTVQNGDCVLKANSSITYRRDTVKWREKGRNDL